MQHKINSRQIELAHVLIQNMKWGNFEYIYRGAFTQNINTNILSLTEPNLDKSDDTSRLKKRIYFVMVECLQNITRHQDAPLNGDVGNSGIFILQKKDNKYFVYSGNLITADKVSSLKAQIENLNNLDKEDIKRRYQELLLSGEISEKGGAGLGLLAMARKTGNKLGFGFREVDEHHAYFYLRTEIPLNEEEQPSSGDEVLDSIESAKNLHIMLDQENILLNFNGAFNHDNLVNLLPIIREQMQASAFVKKRVFRLMIEMLQNVVNYAEDLEKSERMIGYPGIFLLGREGEDYYLTAGNYLQNEKVETLKRKIEFVNNIDAKGLEEFYNKTLLHFERDYVNNPDLSIIEMRQTSGLPLNFEFYPVNDRYSFFTLQTVVAGNETDF